VNVCATKRKWVFLSFSNDIAEKKLSLRIV
jgi:hypothetical protein